MKVRFCDLFLDETKNGFKIKAEEYLENGKYPIVDQGNNSIAGYTNLEKGIFENIPVIIFGDHTRVIKYIDMPFFLGADGVKILKIKLNNVLPKYLFYYLKNVNIPDTGYNRHFKWLKELNFEIPNLKIQNNIVNNLDRITTIISLRQRQLKKLDELVKSRFIEMFGDPLKNTLKWKIKKLKLIAPANEFTGDIESNNEKYWLLQLDMIESNTGKILSKYFVSLDKIGVSTIKFSKDNVLYSKLRPYLNKVVLPDEAGFATSEMIPLFPTEELNKIFLAFVLRDDGIVRFLNAHVSGSKMPRVQADVFWNLGIILPPSTLQNQFADFVEQTDKSKLEIQKSLDKLEILKKSLMQQYFG